jgi:hypothetical protein
MRSNASNLRAPSRPFEPKCVWVLQSHRFSARRAVELVTERRSPPHLTAAAFRLPGQSSRHEGQQRAEARLFYYEEELRRRSTAKLGRRCLWASGVAYNLRLVTPDHRSQPQWLPADWEAERKPSVCLPQQRVEPPVVPGHAFKLR